MNRNDKIGLVAVGVGLVLAVAACGPGGGGGSQTYQPSVSSQAEARRAAQQDQQQNDEMIRRVNGIIENIGSAEARLRETEESIREEKKALDEVKAIARTAWLGGGITDFRVLQRIGQEKKANIEKALQNAEGTIADARQGAESELQRVNWVSSEEKETRVNQVNQRLSQLGTWTATFSSVAEELVQHDTWLKADE